MKSPHLYSLIAESEEKNRTMIELVVFAGLIVSAVVSIYYAAVQPVVLPGRTADISSNTEYLA